MGRFVPWVVLSVGHVVLGTFCPWDLMSVDVLSMGRFVLCMGHFVLGRFVCAPYYRGSNSPVEPDHVLRICSIGMYSSTVLWIISVGTVPPGDFRKTEYLILSPIWLVLIL